ncbi:multiprotein-bridging factor 1 family protein [Nocardiopsis sp. NPDC058631]|uniref:helix-turn-helix domain-containing protein n=1 Tax=Nocardiopsis sp. NPDC058631 TaxID=3346566 RepID=UPI003646C887
MPEEFALTGWSKLGALVRDTRLSQGLSQAALATRAGVARSWLARVEAGHPAGRTGRHWRRPQGGRASAPGLLGPADR